MIRGHLERLRLKKAMVLLAFLVMLYICGPQLSQLLMVRPRYFASVVICKLWPGMASIIRPLLVMRIKSLRLPCLQQVKVFLKSCAFLSVLLTGNLSVHYRQSSAKSLVVYLTQDGKLLMKTRNNLAMDQALCTGILQVLQEQLMISPHQKLLDSFYQQGSF